MRNNLTADGHPPTKEPHINVLTLDERRQRDHELDCPPSWGVVDDGEARQCPHGKWFVFRVIRRSSAPNYSSTFGGWAPATRSELRRIRKELA